MNDEQKVVDELNAAWGISMFLRQNTMYFRLLPEDQEHEVTANNAVLRVLMEALAVSEHGLCRFRFKNEPPFTNVSPYEE